MTGWEFDVLFIAGCAAVLFSTTVIAIAVGASLLNAIRSEPTWARPTETDEMRELRAEADRRWDEDEEAELPALARARYEERDEIDEAMDRDDLTASWHEYLDSLPVADPWRVAAKEDRR